MHASYKWQVTIIAAIALFLSVLDNTIVAVALPDMRATLHTSIDFINWVAIAYFLAQAAVIPITGYLSDRVGTKIIFLIALAFFIVGSILCATANTADTLIAYRIIQGIGGGAIFPTGFTIVYSAFAPTERGKASALVGGPVLLAPALGPTIGGYLTTTFNWNAIFTVNIPIGLIALILGIVILRGRDAERAQLDEVPVANGRFDGFGLVLSMLGFTILIVGISLVGQLGLSNWFASGCLVGGTLLLVLFVFVELRVDDPVIDLRLFSRYTFSIANILLWAVSTFLIGSLFLLPYFLENAQGMTPLDAGYVLFLLGLASGIGTAISGQLYNYLGPRILVIAGFLLVTLSCIGFTHLTVTTSGLSLQIWLLLRGLGFGFTLIPLQTLALSVIKKQELARASSLLNVTRQVFSAVGVSLLTAYLSQQTHFYTTTSVDTTRICRTQQTQQIQTCLTQHATASGINDTFLLIMIASGICILLAFFVGRDPAVEEARRSNQQMVQTTGPIKSH